MKIMSIIKAIFLCLILFAIPTVTVAAICNQWAFDLIYWGCVASFCEMIVVIALLAFLFEDTL